MNNISIVIPARNEEDSLANLLPEIRNRYPDAEIIVVNDGSEDNTATVAQDAGADRVINHHYGMGNGASIKSGARAATGDILVFMDVDGQHRPDDIGALLEQVSDGYDMAVGTRSTGSHASMGRLLGNGFYNRLASWMTGQEIKDLTSGFRAVKAERFREFLHLLPNGFSYPSTITMAFFRSGYSVVYVPVNVQQRLGRSHLRPVRDFFRFLIIIFRICTLYSPLKLFFPVSVFIFISGIGYYVYTFLLYGRFTNMGAILFITSILVFMIGLVSEQITLLMYQGSSRKQDH